VIVSYLSSYHRDQQSGNCSEGGCLKPTEHWQPIHPCWNCNTLEEQSQARKKNHNTYYDPRHPLFSYQQPTTRRL